jgi:hypothetical protein
VKDDRLYVIHISSIQRRSVPLLSQHPFKALFAVAVIALTHCRALTAGI